MCKILAVTKYIILIVPVISERVGRWVASVEIRIFEVVLFDEIVREFIELRR